MKTVIRKNTWLTRGFMDFGWGNGYVLIPKGNKLHGVSYQDIEIDVHGGLTFSTLVDEEMADDWNGLLDKEDIGKWCVGFDTVHYSDSLSKWSKGEVLKETERLKELLLSYELTFETK